MYRFSGKAAPEDALTEARGYPLLMTSIRDATQRRRRGE